mmetsp:Transcript_40350/g.84743  ORF Transcript_40350/g.84743 Transcript_40350/m.84743 type:complete len:94 (+) Transcript_40350:200-481(+)
MIIRFVPDQFPSVDEKSLMKIDSRLAGSRPECAPVRDMCLVVRGHTRLYREILEFNWPTDQLICLHEMWIGLLSVELFSFLAFGFGRDSGGVN